MKRFGPKRGPKVCRDFREAEDHEAPTTVYNGSKFSYEAMPKKPRGQHGAAGRGSFHSTLGEGIRHSSSGSGNSSGLNSGLSGLFAFPARNSNALVVARPTGRARGDSQVTLWRAPRSKSVARS